MSIFPTTGRLIIALTLVWLLIGINAAAAKQGVVIAPQSPEQKQAADLLIEASALLTQKKPYAARPKLEKAALLWPHCQHIHYNLGCCYEEIGEFPRAITEFEFTLQLDSKLTDCLANIASCYQLMGRPRDAIVWFQGYLQKHPHAADASQVQGMIHALERQAEKQVDSDPRDMDYLASVSPEGRVQRWQRERLPLKVFISNGRDEAGSSVHGFREYYNMIIVDAFNTWVRASNNRLGYTLVTDAALADIVCTWTDRKDFLKDAGNKVEQGVARVASRVRRDGKEEEIGHVRVIVLILDSEGKQNISDDEMKKACLHEIGHALGFAGHSTNNKDIMFFSDSPTVWSAITKRDRATMARLYSDYPELMATAEQPAASDNTLLQQYQPQFPNTAATSGYPSPVQNQYPNQYPSGSSKTQTPYPSPGSGYMPQYPGPGTAPQTPGAYAPQYPAGTAPQYPAGTNSGSPFSTDASAPQQFNPGISPQ